MTVPGIERIRYHWGLFVEVAAILLCLGTGRKFSGRVGTLMVIVGLVFIGSNLNGSGISEQMKFICVHGHYT
jgi:hypothetical protein